MDTNPAAIERELMAWAQKLRPIGKPYVSVLNVASELGTVVALRVHANVAPSSAQIDLRHRPPKIILYRAGKVDGEREIQPSEENLLTPRERFSVAHELGHWIVTNHLGCNPQLDRKSYWEHELAINTFAGCLLVPDWLVENWLKSTPEGTPVEPFALRYWADSECRISEEVVAKQLAKHRESIGFLKVSPGKKVKDGAPFLLTLFSASGNAVRLPHARSHIESPDLYTLLEAERVGTAWLPDLKIGRCDAQALRIAWRRGRPLKTLETIWISVALKNAESPKSLSSQLELNMEVPHHGSLNQFKRT
jgi:hypothetical protein